MPRPKHCFHPTGRSLWNGMGTAGTDAVRCCWCGALGEQRVMTESKSVPRHGPHYERSFVKRGEITTAAQECVR